MFLRTHATTNSLSQTKQYEIDPFLSIEKDQISADGAGGQDKVATISQSECDGRVTVAKPTRLAAFSRLGERKQ